MDTVSAVIGTYTPVHAATSPPIETYPLPSPVSLRRSCLFVNGWNSAINYRTIDTRRLFNSLEAHFLILVLSGGQFEDFFKFHHTQTTIDY